MKQKTTYMLFSNMGTIQSFSDNFNTSKINIDVAEIYQSNLLKHVVKFKNKSRLRII